MRPLLYPPAGPESIGEVLDAGFRIFRSTLLRCLPYSVLAMLTGQLPNIRTERDAWWWSCEIASLLAAVVLWSAVVMRQDRFCRGEHSTTLEDLRAALARLPQLIVLLVLGAVAFLLVVPLLGVAALLLAPGLLPSSWPSFALGLPPLPRPQLWLALSVPFAVFGCYLTPGLMMAWPALLLLRRGPLQAAGYGMRLVRGHWWRAATILTVLSIVIVVLDTLAGVAAALLFTLIGEGDVARTIAMAGATVIVASVVGMPLTCALTLALFSELRVRREGLDLERRISSTAVTQS